MSPIITPLVMSNRVNCQSKSGMSGLHQSLGNAFGVLDRHARSNSRFSPVLEGDVGHKINIARSTVKRLDNGVVLFGNEATAYFAGARDFVVVCIELLVEEEKAANARSSGQAGIAPLNFVADERLHRGMCTQILK